VGVTIGKGAGEVGVIVADANGALLAAWPLSVDDVQPPVDNDTTMASTRIANNFFPTQITFFDRKPCADYVGFVEGSPNNSLNHVTVPPIRAVIQLTVAVIHLTRPSAFTVVAWSAVAFCVVTTPVALTKETAIIAITINAKYFFIMSPRLRVAVAMMPLFVKINTSLLIAVHVRAIDGDRE